MMIVKHRLIALLLALAVVAPLLQTVRAQSSDRAIATAAQLRAAKDYIKRNWQSLKRSNAQLAEAAIDPKFPAPAGGRWPVYVSRKEDLKQVEKRLRAQMPEEKFAKIELRQLPESGAPSEHGLLYLPYPYVVPGGRFNEMYGWDSYFIQVGLLRDGELELAKNMIDNFIYQIEHYGKVLNANRTYFLTRSQPPFLTQMILGVYAKTRDRAWLQSTLPALEKYYAFWTAEPHLTKQTGLSRYYDFGEGPAPEVISDERDAEGRTHYDRVKQYYRTHEVKDYDLSQYYDREADQLTALFYKGDRSMRESGFDPSNRFGPFNADIIHYNPVCLNSLLYLMETEAAEIVTKAGRSRDAARWLSRARERRDKINRLMWDAADGLYYDYNFVQGRVRKYPFATTFYPLWAGIADRAQAARIVANLKTFERAGGLLTSTNVSGSQWDAPFGWAPLQMIAVKGLRRYGYNREADRIAASFLSMILKEFIEHNVIVEKYDVERRESQVSAGLKFGYTSNEIGFGWTNAAFTELYANMPPQAKQSVLKVGGASAAAQSGVIDLQSRPIDPFQEGQAVVLVFTRTDCPISNRYAPEVNRIYRKYASKGVMFWMVYADPDESPGAIRKHVEEYGYRAKVLRDTRHELVKAAGAEVTPEAAVFALRGGKPAMLYRGRIDDRFTDFGKARPAPTTRDLEDALDQLLSGRLAASRVTQAIGCFIPDLQ